MPSDVLPDGRQEERGANGYETKKEDDNSQVFLVHKMMSQAGAAISYAAIGKLDVKLAQCRRDVNDEETVKEADRCVSARVSMLASILEAMPT